MDNDEELKKLFIYRYKKMFLGHLRFLENAKENGAVDEDYINRYKNKYKEIVYDGAKKAYTEHKLEKVKQVKKVRQVNYYDDLFSAEV